MTEAEIKSLVCDALTSFALADHLGDVRDGETSLWKILGVEPAELREVRCESESPFEALKVLAARHSLPVPNYVLED